MFFRESQEICALLPLAHKTQTRHGHTSTSLFVKCRERSWLEVPGGGGAQTPPSAWLRCTGLQSSISGRRYKLGCTCRFSCSVCWPDCLYLRQTETACGSNGVQTHFDHTLTSFKRHLWRAYGEKRYYISLYKHCHQVRFFFLSVWVLMRPLLTEGGAASVVMLRTVPDPVAFARVGPPAGVAPQAPGCRATAAFTQADTGYLKWFLREFLLTCR